VTRKYCHERAARCVELAGETTDPELKRTLAELTESWRRLALEIAVV
jgi:hypothetical protein